MVFAPPCCSWVFLSRSVTKRSWANPEGDTTNRSVILTNIFVRRMLYMYLGSNVGMIDRFFLLSKNNTTVRTASKFVLCCEAWSSDIGGATSFFSAWPINLILFYNMFDRCIPRILGISRSEICQITAKLIRYFGIGLQCENFSYGLDRG